MCTVTSIQEWYEYGGHPHSFRVSLDATGVVPDDKRRSRVLQLLSFYKNLRSYLDRIEYIIRADEDAVIRMGGQMASIVEICIPENADAFDFDTVLRVGGLAAAVATVPVASLPDEFVFGDTVRLGGKSARQATLCVPNRGDDLMLRSTGYVGGRCAAITTITMPTPQDAGGQ